MRGWVIGVVGGLVLSGCATASSAPPAPSPSPTRAAASAGRPEAPARLIDDARWVARQGERALRVSPNRELRGSLDASLIDDAWRRLVSAVPGADSPGMRDQFVCHAYFAPGKDGWYLEPARPAVGYAATVLAGCNPGDVMDVG